MQEAGSGITPGPAFYSGNSTSIVTPDGRTAGNRGIRPL